MFFILFWHLKVCFSILFVVEKMPGEGVNRRVNEHLLEDETELDRREQREQVKVMLHLLIDAWDSQ